MAQAKPPVVVSLEDLLVAIESSGFEDNLSFVDLNTGEVVTVSRSLLGRAEESDEDDEPPEGLPEWQQDEWDTCVDIAGNRGRTLRQIAIEWCKENNLKWK